MVGSQQENKMFEKYHHLLSKSPIGSVPCLIPEASKMLSLMPPPSTHLKWIDVGSGQGSWTMKMREMGYNVIPIDLDASQFGGTFVADMHDIPFEDDTFSGVFCTGTFEHAFAPYIVLSEFRRITRSGGVILLNLPKEDNVKMLEDAGHYCAVSKLQMEHQYCTKLGFKIFFYEENEWDPVVGPHQIFGLEVWK